MKSLFIASLIFYSFSTLATTCPIEFREMSLNSKSVQIITEALATKNYEVTQKANLQLIIFNYGWDRSTPYDMSVEGSFYNDSTRKTTPLYGHYRSSNLRQLAYLDTDQSMKRKAVLNAIKSIPACVPKSEICFKSLDEKYSYARKWVDTYGALIKDVAYEKGITGFGASIERTENGCPQMQIHVKSAEDLESAKALIQSVRQEKDLVFDFMVTGTAVAN